MADTEPPEISVQKGKKDAVFGVGMKGQKYPFIQSSVKKQEFSVEVEQVCNMSSTHPKPLI